MEGFGKNLGEFHHESEHVNTKLHTAACASVSNVRTVWLFRLKCLNACGVCVVQMSMSVWLLTEVVITCARTAQAPFSVTAAGVSVWTRTGSPASVSVGNHVKGSRHGRVTPETHC